MIDGFDHNFEQCWAVYCTQHQLQEGEIAAKPSQTQSHPPVANLAAGPAATMASGSKPPNQEAVNEGEVEQGDADGEPVDEDDIVEGEPPPKKNKKENDNEEPVDPNKKAPGGKATTPRKVTPQSKSLKVKDECATAISRCQMLETAIATQAQWKWAKPEVVTAEYFQAKKNVMQWLAENPFAQTFILDTPADFKKKNFGEPEKLKGFNSINDNFVPILENLQQEMGYLLEMHAARKARDVSKKVKAEKEAEK